MMHRKGLSATGALTTQWPLALLFDDHDALYSTDSPAEKHRMSLAALSISSHLSSWGNGRGIELGVVPSHRLRCWSCLPSYVLWTESSVSEGSWCNLGELGHGLDPCPSPSRPE
ncbi:hypothetical protein BKA59DRAFT_244849 [Fusarium tricinctum]|uniref:Uncharacterized protein n=1 Tax=Fusarium tricinctum TaxID=61284 RepID=A0A8K0W9B8_9HYPO|nr:hypothetical protein BKA59DRAFT_244849 [Fusarium tricinctum]